MKEKLAKAVCLFLAEMLRSRKASLRRSADIAAAVVVKLDNIQSEEEFLSLIRGLEYEFQELRHLDRDIVFYHQVSEREKLEKLVREFAVRCLPDDPQRAVILMEEALKAESTLESLGRQFPDFAEFIAIHAQGGGRNL